MRLLSDFGLGASNKTQIASSSKAFTGKQTKYKVSIFLEGIFLVKSILYAISWAVKLISKRVIFRGMVMSGKAVKWKINFIDIQMKIHFTVMMSAAMDTFFFGTRIFLFRKANSFRDLLVKLFCGFLITLMTLDFVEVVAVSVGVRYTPEECSEESMGDGVKEGKNNDFGANFERTKKRRKSIALNAFERAKRSNFQPFPSSIAPKKGSFILQKNFSKESEKLTKNQSLNN